MQAASSAKSGATDIKFVTTVQRLLDVERARDSTVVEPRTDNVLSYGPIPDARIAGCRRLSIGWLLLIRNLGPATLRLTCCEMSDLHPRPRPQSHPAVPFPPLSGRVCVLPTHPLSPSHPIHLAHIDIVVVIIIHHRNRNYLSKKEISLFTSSFSLPHLTPKKDKTHTPYKMSDK